MKSNRKILIMLCAQFSLIMLLCGCDAAQKPVPSAAVSSETQETQPPIKVIMGETEPPTDPPSNEANGYCSDRNILEDMRDGMDDPITRELFREYFKGFFDTISEIRYVDFDLNDDGLIDKMAILKSSFLSDPETDPFYVAINTGNGYELGSTDLYTSILRRSDHSGALSGCIRIMKQKNEGFYVLEVECEENYGWIKYYMVYHTIDGDGRYRQRVPPESINIENEEFLLDYNVLEYMNDGLGDPVTRALFEEELTPKPVNSEVTFVLAPEINYFDFDLNDDGLEDKIVILVSGAYSGTAGDTLKIAINTGSGYAWERLCVSTRAFRRSLIDGKLAGSVRITKQKSEGFYILKIEGYEHSGWNRCYLVYEGEGYQYKTSLEDTRISRS